MKILHTSDWHLGHTLYNYDRTEEQADMMDQVVEIARREQPDAFLLSGDVYHTSAPSAAVQRRFADAILRLHEALPSMEIVVTAGNHDSGTRHEVVRDLWSLVRVHMIGAVDVEHPEELLVDIPGKGTVIAVPYLHERYMPAGFYPGLQRLAAERTPDGLPIVMMAHTTVEGCNFAGHDNASERTVGGIDSLAVEQLGDGFDYLALGHIHRPQNISPRIRYSGTPLAVSFDERFEHSVSVVDIPSRGAEPQLRTVPIVELRPMVTLPTHEAQPLEEVMRQMEEFPDDSLAYIRLNVAVESFLPPNASAQAQAVADRKQCRFCYINVVRTHAPAVENIGMTVTELRQIEPVDLARRYAEEKGAFFDEDLFSQALQQASLQQDEPLND